jgi:hypothetical protein
LQVVYRHMSRLDSIVRPTRSKEHRIEPLGGFGLYVQSYMRVSAQSLWDVRVTEHLLHHLRVFAVLQHKGCCGV